MARLTVLKRTTKSLVIRLVSLKRITKSLITRVSVFGFKRLSLIVRLTVKKRVASSLVMRVRAIRGVMLRISVTVFRRSSANLIMRVTNGQPIYADLAMRLNVHPRPKRTSLVCRIAVHWPDGFAIEKNKQLNKPIRLYVLHDYDSQGNNRYFAENKNNIIFNGVTYEAFPITIESIPENSQGEIDGIKLKVSNVSREIQYYLENYELRGKKVTIFHVWENKLDDTENYRKYVFYIDMISSSSKFVEFTCSSKWDIIDVVLPVGVYMRGPCRWLAVGGYKGPQCLAVSELTTCDGNMASCRARNNIVRYGGTPSVPQQRTFFS